VPVQEFLQTAFLDAWAVLVKAVGDLEGVCGFEVGVFAFAFCFTSLPFTASPPSFFQYIGVQH
jgi:hypothetical protein